MTEQEKERVTFQCNHILATFLRPILTRRNFLGVRVQTKAGLIQTYRLTKLLSI